MRSLGLDTEEGGALGVHMMQLMVVLLMYVPFGLKCLAFQNSFCLVTSLFVQLTSNYDLTLTYLHEIIKSAIIDRTIYSGCLN